MLIYSSLRFVTDPASLAEVQKQCPQAQDKHTSVLYLAASVKLLAGCAAPGVVSKPSKSQAACFALTHVPFGGW